MFFRPSVSAHEPPPAVSNIAAPPVECTQLNPSLRVRDVARAIEFYTTRLGFTLGFTWGEPLRMAAVNLDEVRIFLQQGDRGTVPGQVYFAVDDADALHAYQAGNGVSFEPLGEGVASAHTSSDLRYIATLKAKHGIDYDCHASYRFVEKGEGR